MNLASKVHVVGLGVESGGSLADEAISALDTAEIIIGAERQLDWLSGLGDRDRFQPKFKLLPKLSELKDLIDGYDSEVAVLASGDPLYFGIGRWLGRHFPSSQLCYYSAVSSIQAACSRLGLALQDCHVVSLHGRPLNSLKRHLQPGRTLIILTDRYSHPGALAGLCVEAGLAESTLWVCERLGYSDERLQCFQVGELDQTEQPQFDELQVSVLQLRGSGGRYPAFPGLDDRLLVTDGEPGQGMITKREVRLQILSLLQAGENQVLWDVGAGCGGVSTELALWQPSLRIHAVEPRAERVECLHANRDRFGCSNLQVIEGRAPQVLADLPDPDRIFIGGSDGELETLLQICWQRLGDKGMLVASAVTDASREKLESFAAAQAGAEPRLMTLAVSHQEYSDGQWQQIDKRPVTLLQLNKSRVGS